MFQIVIVPRDTAANLCFSFRTKEAAEKMYALAAAVTDPSNPASKANSMELSDDYGFKFSIDPRDIIYTLFIDVEQGQWVEFEKRLTEDKASQAIQGKLMTMGYKPAPPSPKPNGPRIIRG